MKVPIRKTSKSEDEGYGLRTWIKTGGEPLRYEYGHENPGPNGPLVKDQLAYVKEEKHSSYFHWETYTRHDKGAKPSREAAQDAAIAALRKEKRE